MGVFLAKHKARITGRAARPMRSHQKMESEKEAAI